MGTFVEGIRQLMPVTTTSSERRAQMATWLLFLSAFMITARAPMGFVLLALGPLGAIVLGGLHHHTGLRLRLLWALLVSMLACAAVAVGVLHSDQLTNPASSLAVAMIVTVVAVGTLYSGAPRRGAERLMEGVVAGLLFHWLVSMGEVASGVKLLPRLYPDANTAAQISSRRFFVASLFPNYNDYSVAMTLLVTVMWVRVLFAPRVHPLRGVARWVVLLSAAFEVVYMGSRGCLLALLAMAALTCLLSIRQVRPGQLGPRFITASALVVTSAAGVLVLGSYLADNSNMVRLRIVGDATTLMGENWPSALFGWGSYPNYAADARTRFGNVLMDPHNMVLEIALLFGLPTMCAYLFIWWRVCWREVLRRTRHDWHSAALAVVATGYPLLGVVSSSTLRYYLVWLFTIAAVGRRAAVDREAARAISAGA